MRPPRHDDLAPAGLLLLLAALVLIGIVGVGLYFSTKPRPVAISDALATGLPAAGAGPTVPVAGPYLRMEV